MAKDDTEVVGITGDGSFQTNVQELQTIKHYNLPVKLFVWKQPRIFVDKNYTEKIL